MSGEPKFIKRFAKAESPNVLKKPSKCIFTKGQQFLFEGEASVRGKGLPEEIEEGTVVEIEAISDPERCLYNVLVKETEGAQEGETLLNIKQEDLKPIPSDDPPPPTTQPPPPPTTQAPLTTAQTSADPQAPGTKSVIKRAKISSIDQLNKGGPTGREIIHLAGQKYYIDYDKESRARRSDIFDKNVTTKKLTDDEQKLLDAIGVTENTKTSLKPHLAEFFNKLPFCQSSSQMITNRKCETAYYIIWSVLLKARQAAQQKINESASGLSDKETHMLSAATDAMSGVPGKSNLSANDKTGIMAIIKQIESELSDIKTRLNAAKNKK